MKAHLPKNQFSGGANNLQQLAAQAQKMQKQMDEVNDELDQKEYTATAGGNVVSATVKGTMEIIDITLDKSIIDPEEPDMITDLIIAAVNEALKKAQGDRNARLDAISDKINIPGMF